MAQSEVKMKMSLDSSGVGKALGRARASVNDFASSSFNKLNSLAKFVTTGLVGAFIAFSRRAIGLGSELSDIAESTGFATKEFQVFRGALIDAGGKSESMEKAITLMQKAVVQGSEGMTTYTRAFERLGLNVDDLRKMRPEQQFQAIGRAISGATDQQGALTAAIEIFGQRNAPRLMEVFKRLNKDGYGKMAEEIKKTYGIMDASTQSSLDLAADRIERFKNRATIKIGELISMEGDGAAFKMLGLQFAKVAANFGVNLLQAVLDTAKKASLAFASSLKAAFSRQSFEEVYQASLEQFPVEQNKLLKSLGDINDEFYDEQIKKQKEKLDKAKREFEQQNKKTDTQSASGTSKSTASEDGETDKKDFGDLDKLSMADLEKRGTQSAKSGRFQRFTKSGGETLFRKFDDQGKKIGDLTPEQMKEGISKKESLMENESKKQTKELVAIRKEIERNP